jgi:hypothetical protein
MGLVNLRSWAEFWNTDRVDIRLVVHADFVSIHQAAAVNTCTREGSWCQAFVGKVGSIAVLGPEERPWVLVTASVVFAQIKSHDVSMSSRIPHCPTATVIRHRLWLQNLPGSHAYFLDPMPHFVTHLRGKGMHIFISNQPFSSALVQQVCPVLLFIPLRRSPYTS